METIRISKVEGRTSPKTGKMYYQVSLEDGRKATTFDNKVAGLTGALVGCDLVQNGDFLNIKVFKVIATAEKSSDIGIPMGTISVESIEKVRNNPVFAFLGACILASPMVTESLSGGNNIEDTAKAVKDNFSPFMQLAQDLFETHIVLADTKEEADKILN